MLLVLTVYFYCISFLYCILSVLSVYCLWQINLIIRADRISTHLRGKELEAPVDVLHLLDPQHSSVWPTQLLSRYDLQQLHQQLSIAEILEEIVYLKMYL